MLPQGHDEFLENFSMLTASGMDVLSALAILCGGAQSAREKRMIAGLKSDIENGIPLYQAFKKIGMSAYALSLVRLGEESGRLSEHLDMIVAWQRKNRTLQGKIRSAMIYPVLILSVSLMVAIGIAWFILPQLAGVFSRMDIELPFFTAVLLGFGMFLQRYGAMAVPLFLLLFALAAYLLFWHPRTRSAGAALLLSLPALRRIIQEIELARFGSLLGSLLGAGLPIIDALRSLSGASSIGAYAHAYARFACMMEDGLSLSDAIKSSRAFSRLIPPHVQGMLMASEQSGRLANTLLGIGTRYEEKSAESSKNLSSLLEPFLLLIIWLGVVGIALAVILPIYNLIGGFRAQ